MNGQIPIQQHQAVVTGLQIEINHLKEQVAWFQKQFFGQKAEKFVDPAGNQLEFDGFKELSSEEKQKKKKVEAHLREASRQKGTEVISIPEHLPLEKVVLDIKEEEKKRLVKIGEEITNKLAFKPGSYFIKQIIRPKYADPAHSEAGIVIEPLPDTLLTRCQADESLLAHILVQKYADHLPLTRQSEILFRQDIYISKQTMCNWVIRCGEALTPLYEEMKNQILLSNNVFVDETPVAMLDPGRGKTKQTYMWVMVGGNSSSPAYRVYNFRTDRCHHHAKDLLIDYHGVLHSDKYEAYEVLANRKQLTWSPCWVHIRRKFYEAESGDPKFREWVLRKIKYLFWFEKIAWKRSPEERLRIRQEKEIPVIDELIHAVKNRLTTGKVLPKSKFREALGYFCSLIPHLKNYTRYEYARMDNNVAERAVRPLTIGRKNWMFVGSEDGGHAAAVILSLVQTARAMNINPQAYLEDIMKRIMGHPANRLYELLPDQWMQSHKK